MTILSSITDFFSTPESLSASTSGADQFSSFLDQANGFAHPDDQDEFRSPHGNESMHPYEIGQTGQKIGEWASDPNNETYLNSIQPPFSPTPIDFESEGGLFSVDPDNNWRPDYDNLFAAPLDELSFLTPSISSFLASFNPSVDSSAEPLAVSHVNQMLMDNPMVLEAPMFGADPQLVFGGSFVGATALAGRFLPSMGNAGALLARSPMWPVGLGLLAAGGLVSFSQNRTETSSQSSGFPANPFSPVNSGPYWGDLQTGSDTSQGLPSGYYSPRYNPNGGRGMIEPSNNAYITPNNGTAGANVMLSEEGDSRQSDDAKDKPSQTDKPEIEMGGPWPIGPNPNRRAVEWFGESGPPSDFVPRRAVEWFVESGPPSGFVPQRAVEWYGDSTIAFDANPASAQEPNDTSHPDNDTIP